MSVVIENVMECITVEIWIKKKMELDVVCIETQDLELILLWTRLGFV